MQVEVVDERCEQVAQTLATLGISDPVEPWSPLADDVNYDLATLNLAIVAICHQTQLLGGEIDGTYCRGWDYLQVRFLNWAREDGSRIAPGSFASFSAGELCEVLRSDQLSVTDMEHRASLVRDCGVVLGGMGARSFTELYERCGRRIATTDNNLTTMLRLFRAFNDPVRKKSLFLLGLNAATCGWAYEDGESLDPPVDYHEVRGHLRLGTVRLIDDSLRRSIACGDHVDEPADVAIRSTVTQAIRRVSELSGFAPMKLHYAFWNLFREVCLRKQPLCRGKLQDRLPASYRNLVANDSCCFINCCDSAESRNVIDEHRFETDWY